MHIVSLRCIGVVLQGEGEEEETDELIGQVLDEIGISTTTQVSQHQSRRAGEGVGVSHARSTSCCSHASQLVLWVQ